jgi:hypothetical protein
MALLLVLRTRQWALPSTQQYHPIIGARRGRVT